MTRSSHIEQPKSGNTLIASPSLSIYISRWKQKERLKEGDKKRNLLVHRSQLIIPMRGRSTIEVIDTDLGEQHSLAEPEEEVRLVSELASSFL